MQYTKLGATDPAPYRTEFESNRTIRKGEGGRTLYRGYAIEAKRDFGEHGFLISGHSVKHGYVVTDGGIVNVMPGATWFLTVFDAMTAIDDLITAQSLSESPTGEHPFWALRRFRRNCEERATELAVALQELIDALPTAVTRDGVADEAKALLDQIDDNCDKREIVISGDARTKVGERRTGRFGL